MEAHELTAVAGLRASTSLSVRWTATLAGEVTEEHVRVLPTFTACRGAVSALGVLVAALAGCSAPTAQVARSEHFDGSRFHNTPPSDNPSLLDVLRWRLGSHPPDWSGATPARQGVPPLRVTWVGHATLLVQTAGLNILTDPVWSDYVGPARFVGVARAAPPGVHFDLLPPIDLVLLSHDHYDHMDLPTLRRLVDRDHPRILTGAGNEQRLAHAGIEDAEGLDWWDCRELRRVRVCATPARHNSGRGLHDHDRSLWLGFYVSSNGASVYFAGDTAWGNHFGEVRARLGAPCVALLPIGAYEPRWFMQPVHVSPEEAVHAHDVLGASFSIAMHYGTFRLSDEGRYEPVEKLRAALAVGRHSPFLALPLGGWVSTHCDP
jgi:L-ascorbate metabolism protein UlaG (beta-lactamase superfamily)